MPPHSISRYIPVVLALTAVLSGCSSRSPTSTAVTAVHTCQSPSPSPHSGDSDAPVLGRPAPDQVAALGHPLILKGSGPGEQATVTFLQVIDPACGVGGNSLLFHGMKYVGLRLRLVDSGRTPYSDGPSICTWGRTDTGTQVGSFVFPTLSEGSAIAPHGILKLKPGQSATGYVVMEIPQHAHLTRIYFTLDAGFADETGEWKFN